LPVSARRDRAAIGPLPPLAVLSRFGVGEEAELGQRYDRDGARLGQALIDSLPDDFALDEATVLDFESQAGQTIRHLLSEARSPRELWASDPDPAGLSWLVSEFSSSVRAIPQLESPPLDAPPGHFDLVYAMTAFTHLGEDWAGWLAEIHRVLKPGGLFLAGTLGESAFTLVADEPWEADRIGHLALGQDFATPPRSLAFVSSWWLQAHWGRGFEIIWVRAGRLNVNGAYPQDLVLLRRGSTPVSAELLAAPEPGESRELEAAVNAAAVASRELARVRTHMGNELAHQAAASRAALNSAAEWELVATHWEDRAEELAQGLDEAQVVLRDTFARLERAEAERTRSEGELDSSRARELSASDESRGSVRAALRSLVRRRGSGAD